MIGCCLITFCFPLWNYWKETIISHNHLQYCMCIAEYWIVIMSIEFGSASVVIFLCIFIAYWKENEKKGRAMKKFSGSCRAALAFLNPSHTILCFAFPSCSNRYPEPLHSTHILRTDPVTCCVWSLHWLWGRRAGLVPHPLYIRENGATGSWWRVVTNVPITQQSHGRGQKLPIPISKRFPLTMLPSN